jgi:hypothetical protein
MPSVDLGDWNAESVDHDPFAQPPAAPDDSGVTSTSDPLGSSVTVAKDQTPPAPDDAPKLAGHVAAQQEPGQLLTPKYLAAHPQGTIGAYNPSWAEDIQQGVSNLAERAGVPTEGAERMAGTVRAGAEMAPITGNILSGNEAYRDADRGDLWSAALHTAMALPIPGASAEEGAARRVVSDSGFYSHAADVASQFKQETGTTGQFLAQLRKSGVKPDEIAQSGLDKIDPASKITKADLIDGFHMAMPDIKETQLAEPSEDQVLASAKANFSQTIAARNGMTWEDLPAGSQANYLRWSRQGFDDSAAPKFKDWSTPGGDNYRELLLHLPDRRAPDYDDPSLNYTHAHWDTPNVLAHLRLMDREGPDGQKLLHVDELQSDWGQATRRFNQLPQVEQDAANYNGLYDQLSASLKDQNISLDTRYGRARTPDTLSLREWQGDRAIDPSALNPETRALWDRLNAANVERAQNHFKYRDYYGPPSGPFVGSTSGWTDLGLKRALTEAARGGYDGMIWTPGDDQVARYPGLEKRISQVQLQDNASGGIGPASMDGPFTGGQLRAHDENGNVSIDQSIRDADHLGEVLGPDLAQRLLSADPKSVRSAGLGVRQRHLAGLDERIGGEGMREYYNNILPQRLKQQTQKLDKSVRPGQISLNDPFNPDVGSHSVFQTEDEAGRPLFGVENSDYTVSHHPSYAEARKEADRLNAEATPPQKTYPYIPITPLMREKILKGLPQYAEGGAVDDAPDETTLEPVDHDPFAGVRGDGLGGQTDPDSLQAAARQPEATPSSAGQPPMSAQDREALIRTVYGEASDQPDLGKAGVAHAILNRVAAGGYGDSIHDVVMAPAAGVDPKRGFHEFSPWNPPGVPEGNPVAQHLSPDSRDPNQAAAYRHIGDIVDKVYSGLIPDPTHGATHYYGYMPRPPKWAAPLAKQNMVKIGGQTFVGGSTGPGQQLPSQITGGLQDIGAGAT